MAGELEQPERRQTPSERQHEALMAALTKPPAAAESSVELTRNAKGDYQWSITVRAVDPYECEQIAEEIDRLLARQYPRDPAAATEPADSDDAAAKAARQAAAIASSAARGRSK